jgi:hypothetical protein
VVKHGLMKGEQEVKKRKLDNLLEGSDRIETQIPSPSQSPNPKSTVGGGDSKEWSNTNPLRVLGSDSL